MNKNTCEGGYTHVGCSQSIRYEVDQQPAPLSGTGGDRRRKAGSPGGPGDPACLRADDRDSGRRRDRSGGDLADLLLPGRQWLRSQRRDQ